MAEAPWERWIPGVLSRSQVSRLCNEDYLHGFSSDTGAFDHSSVDVHLSGEAYELPEGSVKPSGARYLSNLNRQKLAVKLQRHDNGFLLEARKTYLFKLQERLASTGKLQEGDVHGQATAKSSIGRLDVLARLIVDGSTLYEAFDAAALKDSTGELFLEITPMTFPIIVREGNSLSQIRFFRGAPETAEIHGETIAKAVLTNAAGPGHMLSADLTSVTVAGNDAVAFRSRKRDEIPRPIDLSVSWSGQGEPDPRIPKPQEYWDIIPADENNRLKIEAGGSFYIIRSHERMAVPKGVAVYCRAIDETIGEIRIHYAGFVHPFFGTKRSDRMLGTPLIFEVRGHDVNVSLSHLEKMARLVFYRMSEDAEEPPTKASTSAGPDPRVRYMNQALELSKHFGPWPDRLASEASKT